jgi:hypothetical protein
MCRIVIADSPLEFLALAGCPPSAYAEDEWLRHRNQWSIGWPISAGFRGPAAIGFLHGADSPQVAPARCKGA